MADKLFFTKEVLDQLSGFYFTVDYKRHTTPEDEGSIVITIPEIVDDEIGDIVNSIMEAGKNETL